MKIPVILVTGFLGSGKTTFLRRLAQEHPDWRLIFLVNEFAETSVDGDTLAAGGTPTQSVVGGSLFCECKASEFVRVMRETVLGAHREQALDAVIIETSGIADPEAMGTVMREFALEDDFAIAQVVTVLAPKSFLKLVDNLPIIKAQIQASDLVILNKTDLASTQDIAAAEEVVLALQPQVTRYQARHCAIPFSLKQERTSLPQAPLATCDANPFETLTDWLRTRDPAVVRVKGRVQTEQGWQQIDASMDSLSIEPSAPAETAALVLIAHEDDEEKLAAAGTSLTELWA